MDELVASSWQERYQASLRREEERIRQRTLVARRRPRGFPKRGDLDFANEIAFVVIPPILVVSWLLSKLWFRGTYNVVVVESGGGRAEKLIWPETAPDKRSADRRVDELRREIAQQARVGA